MERFEDSLQMLFSHANALVGNLNLNIGEAFFRRTVLDDLDIDIASLL
jgi:hypothetical protein